MELLLHIVSTVVMIVASLLAIRLSPISGRRGAWLLLCAAILLMVLERVLEMLAHHNIFLSVESNEGVSDVLHLLFSLCMLGSVIDIRHLFVERENEHRLLNNQLNELQRFHQLSIGRELRMKELFEENAKLKEQVMEGHHD